MNIKVSGITSIQQLMELDTLDIDYVGLVFDKDSDQYAEKNIPSDQVKSLDFDIKKVGIFVNAEFDEIIARIESYNLDLVQLNGSESPDFCRLLAEQEIMLIKSFYLDSFNSEIFADTLAEYDEVCDYYSFDFTSASNDFSNIDFSRWDFIKQTEIQKPYFLGGNTIKPSDARFLNKFRHPDYFGVDLNLHFEKTPGFKEMAMVLTFVQAIRQVNN